MTRPYGRVAAMAGVAFAGYVAYGIYEAGLHDRPAPPSNSDIVFRHGNATGQRITTRSWSADYERIVSNADQTVLQLDNVRHGIIYKRGKPYLSVRAAHMTVNTVSRDFSVLGPLHVETVGVTPARSFDTSSANWNDGIQTLTLAHHIVIHNGSDDPLSVGSLTFDVKTGELEVHAIDGPVQFR